MRLLITGAQGQLGVEVGRRLADLGQVIGCGHSDLDVTDPTCPDRLAGLKPDWVVHLAAATDVDRCEREPAFATAVNAEGTRRVAEGCRRVGAGLVYLSTDYVFDGRKGAPYTETDAPAPLNVYGRAKLEGEEVTRSLASPWVIVRTSWLFGEHGRNFVKTILAKAKAREPLRVVDDQVGSPTYARDLADGVAVLLSRGITGCFHLTNSGACSWYEFAQEILRLTGSLSAGLGRISSAELNRPAPRPGYSALENAAWQAAGLSPLRPWREALAAMLSRLEVNWSSGRGVHPSERAGDQLTS